MRPLAAKSTVAPAWASTNCATSWLSGLSSTNNTRTPMTPVSLAPRRVRVCGNVGGVAESIRANASFSPDALTGMESNLRSVGAETADSKIFGRLSAWQNWIFIRPNATGVQVKKAAARANLATGRLPRQIGEAIVEAADEILAVTGGVNPGDVSPEVEEDEPGRPTDPLGRAFAAAVGVLSIRSRGLYFILMTLASGQLGYHLFNDTGIGGSALALAQATAVLAQCRGAFPRLTFELNIIKTMGDKLQTASLANPDASLPKGLFTKELEVALLNGEADLAVHSLKDLPTELPAGLDQSVALAQQ